MFLNRAGVSNHYSHKVRVGNWSEEQELEELRMKEYIHRKEKGQLLVHAIQKHMNSALQEVGLTHSPDGLIHIGDHVMLYSVETEGVLSCDPADKLASSERGFAVTTSTLVKAHVARNTFVVEAYEAQIPVGTPLKLGQQFRLRANPKLLPGETQAYYLHSQPVSALAASKVTRKQLVHMSPVKSYDTVWKCQWQDISRRFENEGQPVPANSEIVIVHAPTNTCLSSSKQTYYNDFGLEYEVCGHSHVDIRKSQGLYAELQGRTTTDVPFRKESRPNHFAFLTAASPDMEEPLKREAAEAAMGASSTSSSSTAAAASSLLANLREDLLARGPDHLYTFLRACRAVDLPASSVATGGRAMRSERLAYGEFRKLLLQPGGVKLSLADFDALCRMFDPAGEGHVAYMDFLRALHGRPAPVREEAIEAAWASLDREARGGVELGVLAQAYDPASDPQVRLGRRGQQAALDAMMEKYRGLAVQQSRVLLKEDFVACAEIASTYCEADAYFCDLMASNWRLNAPASAAAAKPQPSPFTRK